MSMILRIYKFSDASLETVKNNDKILSCLSFIESEDDGMQVFKMMKDGLTNIPENIPEEFKLQYRKSVDEAELKVRFAKDLKKRELKLVEEIRNRSISLEKNWHGIAFLLTGEAYDEISLLGKSVFGETAVGDDLGYGPAKLLTRERIMEIRKDLSEITEDDFISRYDSELMNTLQIYPGGWELNENREILLESFRQFVSFFSDAAAGGYNLIYTMT
ncbi:MAG: DUF1877 family protein [Spirochaetes bacterium]|nr:DUF1877 family protein [Spirochaetota bacterium]